VPEPVLVSLAPCSHAIKTAHLLLVSALGNECELHRILSIFTILTSAACCGRKHRCIPQCGRRALVDLARVCSAIGDHPRKLARKVAILFLRRAKAFRDRNMHDLLW
jgi:hypothetical protein